MKDLIQKVENFIMVRGRDCKTLIHFIKSSDIETCLKEELMVWLVNHENYNTASSRLLNGLKTDLLDRLSRAYENNIQRLGVDEERCSHSSSRA